MSKTSVLPILALAVLVLSAAPGLGLPLAEEQEPISCVANREIVDVFCQKGGQGHLIPSSPFCPGEPVCLYASVTYCDWPEQNCNVAFQVLGPCNRVFFLFGRTNASGIVAVSFRLLSPEHADRVYGAWSVIATASVAEVVVGDTLEFCVKWSLADVNADGEVDVSDAVMVSLAYASTQLDTGWNQDCDVAKTYGVINIYDMATLAMDYGQRRPS